MLLPAEGAGTWCGAPGWAGEGSLVPVLPRFESSEPGLFVVGDAAMVPLPRAADDAVAEGRTAADAILERLGLTASNRRP